MTEDEKYLFEKLREGDEAAFKVIYNKYVPRLYYFVREYIPQADLAENIIQDTLMTLWDKKGTLANDTNLGAYLYTVSKNNCLYKLRDLKYRKRLYDSTNLGDLEIKANLDALSALDTSTLTFSEIEKIIKETMEQLPPQCRVVFQMSRFDEKKYREIAEELSISVKAVEGHMTKALKVFRTNLKDYLPLVAFLFIC
ncbi:MAG TPA: RNA polymerase sigma-70 factor [Prolixibacteraceae bacterium]|jgi:RNA polymerase sigma-70 factor (ECF subfamily)